MPNPEVRFRVVVTPIVEAPVKNPTWEVLASRLTLEEIQRIIDNADKPGTHSYKVQQVSVVDIKEGVL